MRPGLNFVGDIFQSGLMLILLLACAGSLVYGVWMLLQPATALRFNRSASRWVPTDNIASALDDRHSTERLIYRHHRILASILIAGGLYMIYALSGGRWRAGIVEMFSQKGPWMDVVRDAAGVLMLLVGVIALVVGTIMFIRPSLLKGAEFWLNRWVATDKTLKPLDVVIDAPDRFVERHARLFAALIVVGSLYALLALLPLLSALI